MFGIGVVLAAGVEVGIIWLLEVGAILYTELDEKRLLELGKTLERLPLTLELLLLELSEAMELLPLELNTTLELMLLELGKTLRLLLLESSATK